LGHALVNSPIKNRIIMLTTKKSNPTKAFKYAAFIPVLLAGTTSICIAQNTAITQYGSNKVTIEKDREVKMQTKLPNGNISNEIVSINATPIEINDEKIIDFKTGDPNAPQLKNIKGTLHNYLVQQHNKVISELPDGDYQLTVYSLVVDKNGLLSAEPQVYFGRTMVASMQEASARPAVKNDVKMLFSKIEKLCINSIKTEINFRSAYVQEKPVNAYYTESKHIVITVKNKNVSIRR
jgi:hypothetical protein